MKWYWWALIAFGVVLLVIILVKSMPAQRNGISLTRTFTNPYKVTFRTIQGKPILFKHKKPKHRQR